MEENNKIIIRVTPTPETSMLVMNYKSCTLESEAKFKKIQDMTIGTKVRTHPTNHEN